MGSVLLPSELFRIEHQKIWERITHIEALLDRALHGSRSDEREAIDDLLTFLVDELEPHSTWEERSVYPAVDRYAGGEREHFTAPLRREHTIMDRWIHAIEEETENRTPDIFAIARRAHHLFGLLRAHLEVEEDVLLPILDLRMTGDQFDRQILSTEPQSC